MAANLRGRTVEASRWRRPGSSPARLKIIHTCRRDTLINIIIRRARARPRDCSCEILNKSAELVRHKNPHGNRANARLRANVRTGLRLGPRDARNRSSNQILSIGAAVYISSFPLVAPASPPTGRPAFSVPTAAAAAMRVQRARA